MRHSLIFLLLATAGLFSAQKSAGEDARTEIIKSALARDRGDITTMEPSPRDGGGVYVGYSTGTLLHCQDDSSCIELKGTPNVEVRNLAISRRGNQDIIWIAYPLGGFYRCEDHQCRKFEWDSVLPK